MGALAIFDLVEAFLGKAWEFVTTPPWSYLCLAGLFAIAMWWFGQHEFNAGKASCEKAHTVYVTREVVRQQTVVKTVVAKSDAQTSQHASEDQANRGTVRTIYIHDKALPDASAVCVNPDDADRLRGLH